MPTLTNKRPARYPWDEWFSSKRAARILRLVKGVDFHCQPYAMAQQVRNRASQRGRYVVVKIQDDTVIVNVQPEGYRPRGKGSDDGDGQDGKGTA